MVVADPDLDKKAGILMVMMRRLAEMIIPSPTTTLVSLGIFLRAYNNEKIKSKFNEMLLLLNSEDGILTTMMNYARWRPSASNIRSFLEKVLDSGLPLIVFDSFEKSNIMRILQSSTK